MFREEEFSRLEINLSACTENYRYFRSKLDDNTKLLVLVKANAYGHGAVEFASLMEEAGADAVAGSARGEGAAGKIPLACDVQAAGESGNGGVRRCADRAGPRVI